jgi:alpha-ketoglutarate-dependent taurine dioxygenase
MAISVSPIKEHIGVVMDGAFAEGRLVPGAAPAIRKALDRHGVVVFPKLGIDDDLYVEFGRQLGELVLLPRGTLASHPEIEAITRDPNANELAAYRKGTFLWHIDGTTTPSPHRATFLICRQVAEGDDGDTELANGYAGYDSLPDADKAALEGLHVKHSFAAAQRLSYPDAPEKVQKAWEDAPSGVHPLVNTRADGRKWLMVGSTAEQIIGMEPEASRALLEGLTEWCTRPQFVIHHRWSVGDMVMFDNQGVLHRAMPYSTTSPRMMHRIMVQSLAV